MKVFSIADVLTLTSGQRAAVRRLRSRGMSLLEIMVVITLIGLVTAAIGVAVVGQLNDGQAKLARDQAYNIAAAAKIYKVNNGSYPTTAQGIQALTSPPKGRPLLEEIPKDPWGNEYIYVSPGQKNVSSIDVRSKGNDGAEGTDDDVGNWAE